MAIASTIIEYLNGCGVEYDVIQHEHTGCSMETAQSAHVPGDQLAKSVMLEDEDGYLMAVIPATHRVQISKLNRLTQRQLGLVTEPELEYLFEDCEPGAIPALGQAYGIETVWDEHLAAQSDVYFEAGDHEELIHVAGEEFRSLMESDVCGQFSTHS
ncbi:MAG: YbaK/EbsC family protein [Gammaproteobacteria bacterium]|nr:YbaK/EbsC family protein [Gammaproteobacteria bacterium]